MPCSHAPCSGITPRGMGNGRRREFGARNGHALAVVMIRERVAKSLREAGYGDQGGLGLVAARPSAGRVVRALALLPRVLDRQEEGLAVRGEGRSGELRLDGPTGELEHVSTGDPAVYPARHHERPVVLEGLVDAGVQLIDRKSTRLNS